jgi:hypothetical protein
MMFIAKTSEPLSEISRKPNWSITWIPGSKNETCEIKQSTHMSMKRPKKFVKAP